MTARRRVHEFLGVDGRQPVIEAPHRALVEPVGLKPGDAPQRRPRGSGGPGPAPCGARTGHGIDGEGVDDPRIACGARGRQLACLDEALHLPLRDTQPLSRNGRRHLRHPEIVAQATYSFLALEPPSGAGVWDAAARGAPPALLTGRLCAGARGLGVDRCDILDARRRVLVRRCPPPVSYTHLTLPTNR